MNLSPFFRAAGAIARGPGQASEFMSKSRRIKAARSPFYTRFEPRSALERKISDAAVFVDGRGRLRLASTRVEGVLFDVFGLSELDGGFSAAGTGSAFGGVLPVGFRGVTGGNRGRAGDLIGG